MGGKGSKRPFILAEAQAKAKELETILLEIPEVQAVHMCGSIRRKKLMVNDCDVVVVTSEPSGIPIWDALKQKLPGLTKLVCGGHEFRMVHNEMQFDLRAFHPNHVAGGLLFSTGSARFNIMMRSRAKRMGYKLNRYGLWRNGSLIECKREENIFTILNMLYIKPEDRHDDKFEIGMEMGTIDIVGSTGNTYQVILKNKEYFCPCEGFKWRHHCRHVEEARRIMV